MKVLHHVDKIHVRFKIANIKHALSVPVYQQTDFTPKRLVVSNVEPCEGTGVNSLRSEIRPGVM